jgi:putative hydrolase of the HAD superfamily
MKRLVIFDGDDTLWLSEPLYDQARQSARELVEAAGLDGSQWEELERTIDVANVPRLGFSAKRFPTSCVEAYEQLVGQHSLVLDEGLRKAIWDIAASVVTTPAPLVPSAPEVLETLATRATLVLLTQGDPRVQQMRVSHSNLWDYFEAIHAVLRKTSENFSDLLRRFDVPAEHAWSVGNSLPSDINPALSLGMNAVWIPTHVWEYEKRETVPASGLMTMARSLADVPSIVLPDADRHAAAG